MIEQSWKTLEIFMFSCAHAYGCGSIINYKERILWLIVDHSTYYIIIVLTLTCVIVHKSDILCICMQMLHTVYMPCMQHNYFNLYTHYVHKHMYMHENLPCKVIIARPALNMPR